MPTEDLPDEMKFGVRNVVVIVAYVNLMWISLLGNCIVLWKLFYRKNRSRVHFMLLHLCISDLLVTVIEMPLQVIILSATINMANLLGIHYSSFIQRH